MFKLTIQYESKGKTPGVFIVNPDHFREVHGEDLVELLSKFMIELITLQRDIHQQEIEDGLIERHNDDIPF